jgi:hypothetical protein
MRYNKLFAVLALLARLRIGLFDSSDTSRAYRFLFWYVMEYQSRSTSILTAGVRGLLLPLPSRRVGWLVRREIEAVASQDDIASHRDGYSIAVGRFDLFVDDDGSWGWMLTLPLFKVGFHFEC